MLFAATDSTCVGDGNWKASFKGLGDAFRQEQFGSGMEPTFPAACGCTAMTEVVPPDFPRVLGHQRFPTSRAHTATAVARWDVVHVHQPVFEEAIGYSYVSHLAPVSTPIDGVLFLAIVSRHPRRLR